MRDPSQISEPFALRPLLQTLGLCGLLLCTEHFEKQKGFPHDIVSLLPVGLLVVMKQEGQFPGGQRRFGKVF